MKTDEQVLKQCIKIAVDNGWDIVSASLNNDYVKEYDVKFLEFEVGEVEYNPDEYGNTVYIYFRITENSCEDESFPSEYESTLEELLFNHDFCKALFGTQRVNATEYHTTHAWKAVICNLAVEENRIDVLRQFLKSK